jgi:hypothetical protein
MLQQRQARRGAPTTSTMILGFKSAFVPQIQDGAKVHTIRQGRRWKAGHAIHFYQKVRQPGMSKFHPDASVTSTQQVTITHGRQLFVDDRQLSGTELESFALRDGFSNSDLLFKFFGEHHELPFTGQLVHWTDLRY